MISLLHPSRSRADKSFDTANKWMQKQGGLHEAYMIISLDDDDPQLHTYKKVYENCPWTMHKRIIINTNRSAVDAINAAAKVATGDIMIVLSDDTDCPDNWANLIEEETRRKKDFILKVSDGIQSWIITMPCLDRAYYNRFGYIYHPDYQHMFCDTEMSCVADLTGRRITANIPFKHNHYSVGGAVKDTISERADKTWEQGEKLFLSRYRQNFGLINMPGRIQDQGMLNWIKSKGI